MMPVKGSIYALREQAFNRQFEFYTDEFPELDRPILRRDLWSDVLKLHKGELLRIVRDNPLIRGRKRKIVLFDFRAAKVAKQIAAMRSKNPRLSLYKACLKLTGNRPAQAEALRQKMLRRSRELRALKIARQTPEILSK